MRMRGQIAPFSQKWMRMQESMRIIPDFTEDDANSFRGKAPNRFRHLLATLSARLPLTRELVSKTGEDNYNNCNHKSAKLSGLRA